MIQIHTEEFWEASPEDFKKILERVGFPNPYRSIPASTTHQAIFLVRYIRDLFDRAEKVDSGEYPFSEALHDLLQADYEALGGKYDGSVWWLSGADES